MKKSLIALAALAATSAFAQSSVQIVGTFDPSIANEKTTYGDGKSVTQNFVRNNSQGTSQITFKGTEDLGGGLKASFLFENDFDTRFDANGNPFNGKNNIGSGGGEQFLALEGGFGKIQVGAANTPTLTTQASRQPFSTKIGGGFSGGVLGTAHVRNNNSLVYTAPVMAGVTAQLGYAFATAADGNAAGAYNISTGDAKTVASLNTKAVGSIMDLGLFYANGPLAAGFSYYTVDSLTAVAAGATTTATTTAAGKNQQSNLFVSYDLGVAKLTVGYHTESTAAAPGAPAGTAKALDQSGYNVAAVVPLSANLSLLANYAQLDDKLAANADKKISAIGLKYNVSKMTSVYARYVDQTNDNVALTATSTAKKVQTTLVGMQTNF